MISSHTIVTSMSHLGIGDRVEMWYDSFLELLDSSKVLAQCIRSWVGVGVDVRLGEAGPSKESLTASHRISSTFLISGMKGLTGCSSARL